MMRKTFVLSFLVMSMAATGLAQTRPSENSGTGNAVGADVGAQVSGEAEKREFQTYSPSDIVWKDGPASLGKGAQIAVLEGDPGKAGPFVFRVKVPDGFIVKPHTHPRAERVTVIQGTFNIAMHETVAEAQKPGNFKTLPAGSFGYWPAGMVHVAWATGETVVQFHGFGPWVINYVNPQDDPRNAAKADAVQPSDPWTVAQVITPEELAKALSERDEVRPLVLSVSPAAVFKKGHVQGAQFIGPDSTPEGVQALKAAVEKVPHDRAIVVYCGCCPWKDCPNVRPGFSTLKELGFTNVRALYLPHNLQKDWIAAGYPSEKGSVSR
ncbi:MAG TPA: rhodanese-like domain-containing protein [Tepidisphaeraceae bacterium]|jgi:rhodanese-related sulfurtransferase